MFGGLKTALYFSPSKHVCGEQLLQLDNAGGKVIKNPAPLTPWLVLEVGSLRLPRQKSHSRNN